MDERTAPSDVTKETFRNLKRKKKISSHHILCFLAPNDVILRLDGLSELVALVIRVAENVVASHRKGKDEEEVREGQFFVMRRQVEAL